MEIENEQPCGFILGKRIKDNSLNNWQRIELQAGGVILERPCVIFFGGNATRDERAANGNAKFIASLIGQINEPVDVYSVAYMGSDWSTESFNLYCEKFAKELFMPLLIDEKGKRISINCAKKNMRRINVVTHCIGYNRFNLILEKLRTQMLGVQYSEQEIDQILGQIFEIDYAPLDKKIKVYTKQVLFQSDADDVLIGFDEFYFYQKHLMRQGCDFTISPNELQLKENEKYLDYKKRFNDWNKKNPDYIISVLSENNLFYFSSAFTKTEEDDHDFSNIYRNEQFKIRNNVNFNGKIVSVLIADLLIDSISNSIVNENSKKFHPLASMGVIKDCCDSIIKQMLKISDSSNEAVI